MRLEQLYDYDDILLFRQIANEKIIKRKEQIKQKKSKSLFSFSKKKATQFFSKIQDKSVSSKEFHSFFLSVLIK